MIPIEKTINSSDWMTIVLFMALFVLALGKYLYHNRFVNFIILPFNDKYVLLHKKGHLLNWFHIWLTLFQLANLSLFVFLSLKIFDALPEGPSLMVFFILMGFLALFQLFKFSVQFLKAYVFNTQELVSELVFSKTSYFNYSGLVLCAANIILIYILKDSKIVVYAAIVLILLINGIGIAKLLKNYQKAMFPYFVYFILYLCALEIAPLVIIGSYLKD